jgi:type VII secretion protein EccB
VCDAAGSAAPSATTVIVGPVQGSVLGRPVLVVAGTTTYLLYDGHRAVVDLTDRATVRALYLESVAPLPVSLLLLNAIPELPPIRPPLIPDAGRPSAFVGFPVGSVVRIPRADSVENYVVLANGVQRIGSVAADLIRFANSHGDREVISVAPDAIASSPVVDVLPVSTFPETAAPARGSSGLAVMCLTWTPDRTSFLAGKELPLAAGQAPRSLAQADGAGPALDAVFVPPGRTACVHGQTRYLVTDTGVRFAVPDDEAARDLGLDATGSPAPWPVLAALPEGPELSKANALVARDTVTAAGPRKP